MGGGGNAAPHSAAALHDAARAAAVLWTATLLSAAATDGAACKDTYGSAAAARLARHLFYIVLRGQAQLQSTAGAVGAKVISTNNIHNVKASALLHLRNGIKQ